MFGKLIIVLVLAMFYASVAQLPMAHNAIAAASAAGAGLILGTATRLLISTRPPLRGLAMGIAAFVSIGLLHWPLLWVLPTLVALAIAIEWRVR